MSEALANYGLTTAQAEANLARDGLNSLGEAKKQPAILSFLSRFRSPLVLILIVAAILSAFLHDLTSSIIIIVIVASSAILDFVTTARSEKAADELKKRVAVTVTVRRDGKVSEIPLEQIAVGDVVLLSPGDIVPADCKVIASSDIFIDESALTGESYPVAKEIGTAAFMGSNVISGTAEAEVTATGRRTQYGQIAAVLLEKSHETDFDRGIKDFSYLVTKFTLGLVLFIFLVNIIGHKDPFESVLFATALAVGLTPELLPMVVTLNLTRGSLLMSRHGVIVKRLTAIQNFGSMNVLCTDKTGTLTENKLAVVKHVDPFGKDSDKVLLYSHVSSSFQRGVANPLDEAIRKLKTPESHFKYYKTIPFDFNRKRESIIAEEAGRRVIITKGAPEEIFKIIADCELPERKACDAAVMRKINATYEQLSKQGFRVLAVAIKQVPGSMTTFDKEAESAMTLLGFIAFIDPAKKSVKTTLKKMEEYGVEIKILTGDSAAVTARIASEIELPVKGVLSGEEIGKLSDIALAKKLKETTIFARVSPDQKTRIIKLLQKNRHVVGYMGDGINDAPSLKTADVGISVDNAVDIAKSAADFILLHKSLEELIDGVIEGRKTFTNTFKYLMMELSSNFGNMFSMAGASLFLPFLPMLPIQILFNNLVYDTSQLALPFDNVDDADIKNPRKWDIGFLRRFMLVFGPVSSVFDFATFAVLYLFFHATAPQFQTGWFLESLATQTLVVYIIRSHRLPFIESRPSKVLLITTFLALVLAGGLALSPLGHIFKFTMPAAAQLAYIAVIIVLYLISVEFIKRPFYRHLHRRHEYDAI